MAPVKDLELPRLDSVLASLGDYVAIPSDSRNADRDTMRRAADWIAGQLSFAGGHVEETGGHPVVRGEWLGAPGAPTVLMYGHYDVQPTGDESEWLSPPFHLTVDDDIARGRGVSDDKGPVFLVVAMLQAAIAQRGGLPLNVKFLIEGEEEIGSPHLTGLANVVRHLGMLEGDPSPVRPPREHQGWHWIRTPVGGWWEPAVQVGTPVAEGDLVGTISELTGELLYEVRAPAAGVPLFLTTSPAVLADGLLLGLAHGANGMR